MGTDGVSNLSYLVKTVDLPKYSIDTHTLNQYNRKRVVQTKINYDPVTIAFHDDGGDVMRNMWYNYYSYYYKDPTQQYLAPNNNNGSQGASQNQTTGFGYNARDIYSDTRLGDVSDWGFIGETSGDGGTGKFNNSGKPPFFRDITIYGMDQHKFAQYVLINPLITNFSHDQYSYSEGGGTMTNSMTLAYETVKYYTGAIGSQRPDTNVKGFADPSHYDTTLSPISRPGSNSTIMGQGGLLDAGAGILQDLESRSLLGVIGAVQKAGAAKNTFKGKNLASIAKSEAVALGGQAVIGAIPGAIKSLPGRGNGIFIPTAPTPKTN
jgi:hypothetical protein